jgi:hypothetical protein
MNTPEFIVTWAYAVFVVLAVGCLAVMMIAGFHVLWDCLARPKNQELRTFQVERVSSSETTVKTWKIKAVEKPVIVDYWVRGSGGWNKLVNPEPHSIYLWEFTIKAQPGYKLRVTEMKP